MPKVTELKSYRAKGRPPILAPNTIISSHTLFPLLLRPPPLEAELTLSLNELSEKQGWQVT